MYANQWQRYSIILSFECDRLVSFIFSYYAISVVDALVIIGDWLCNNVARIKPVTRSTYHFFA